MWSRTAALLCWRASWDLMDEQGPGMWHPSGRGTRKLRGFAETKGWELSEAGVIGDATCRGGWTEMRPRSEWEVEAFTDQGVSGHETVSRKDFGSFLWVYDCRSSFQRIRCIECLYVHIHGMNVWFRRLKKQEKCFHAGAKPSQCILSLRITNEF